MIAYKNDPNLKQKFISELDWFKQQNRLIKGPYNQKWEWEWHNLLIQTIKEKETE